MKKALVYISAGLGDGLIFLVVCKNLSNNGFLVDTYHPFLSEMQGWIDYTAIKPYPLISDLRNLDSTNCDSANRDSANRECVSNSINLNSSVFDFLKGYDLIIINSDYDPLNKETVKYAKKNFPDITYELHPSTCKGKNPPIGDLKFDFTKTLVENLTFFCSNVLNLKNVEPSNSIRPLTNLIYRKHSKRIAIHPSSKDIEKNWPKEKFLKLCKKLEKTGYEPKLILTNSERDFFEDINIEKPLFNNIGETASFIYESGYMLGNDSGIAHLASSLKIPTLTIFSAKRKERFWKPVFFIGKTVVSWPLINISHLRLREKYWKKTITIGRVLNNFIKLVNEYESGGI